ncbi:hypothetical protein EGH24_06935 [Halonotius terrestris]|uniref:ABC-2 type transport system permease protein n=1 Tax=Halonotius terrestris TaxID=2487750 RepID=A0A8J8TC66_9EURY|nr:ABC transporter permease subunit [Halonotius terrestris]TQQ80888.1 hypothetical protein EGH24_06935 [Halonotius terrestris]
MRITTIYAKTIADLARPKLLVGYFVPLVTFALFFAVGTSNNMLTEGAPLFQQEAELYTVSLFMAYTLGVGMPLQAVCSVFCALTIASESQRGTLRILLSKPIKRWQLYLGTFAGIVSYGLLMGIVGLLVSAVLLYSFADVEAAALGAGVFGSMVGSLAYGLFSITLVTAIGLALAVYTKDRLRTAVGGFVIPVLTFVFITVNLFDLDLYDDFALYLIDPNRHLANVLVFLHETVGAGLPAETQVFMATFAGVYEQPDSPMHVPETLAYSSDFPLVLSVVLLTAVTLVAFVVGLREFSRMDV